MKKDNIDNLIILEPIKKEDLDKFKRDMQESFAISVIEAFGSLEGGPIPPAEDIDNSYNAPGAAVFHITADGKKVGGVILNINKETNHNCLDLFFIYKDEIGHGYGYKAWQAIEEKYPETEVWETVTPYFEKRNIHFYVNKCGFKIVEYYNKHNPEPHMPDGENFPECEEDEDFFRFEKIMKEQLIK